MALSCGRFFRLFRALLVPVVAILAFSSLLTFVFILYQPTPGPGLAQRLGWQSWDTVDAAQQPTTPQDPPSSGTDWWNVTTSAEDASSYPTDAWVPLWPHDTGRAFRHSNPMSLLTTFPVSEIAIARCLVPPGFVGDMCAPDTSAEKDAIKGKWVRVDRDLNLQNGIWTLVRPHECMRAALTRVLEYIL